MVRPPFGHLNSTTSTGRGTETVGRSGESGAGRVRTRDTRRLHKQEAPGRVQFGWPAVYTYRMGFALLSNAWLSRGIQSSIGPPGVNANRGGKHMEGEVSLEVSITSDTATQCHINARD